MKNSRAQSDSRVPDGMCAAGVSPLATTLTNQRGLKGSKLGPANEGRRLSTDEAKKIEEQLRREGKIQ